MQWLRLYHDTPNDPKWRLVAVRSGQPVGNVLAVWVQMLVCASEAEERGTLEDWDDEIVAAMLGYAPAIVTAIRASMQGLVLDGFTLTGWEKRQRASDDAGGRQRKTRERRTPNPPGDSGGGGHSGNGHDRDSPATVARQNDNVARQTENVAGLPLRAQTSDLQKESKEESVCEVGVDPREAHTQGAPAFSENKTSNIVPFVKSGSSEVLPMPDDWTLPNDWYALAIDLGWHDPEGAAERFATHWLGKKDRGDRDAANSEAGWLREWKGWINGNLKWERDHGQRHNDQRQRGHGDLASYVKSNCPRWFADSAGGSNPW